MCNDTSMEINCPVSAAAGKLVDKNVNGRIKLNPVPYIKHTILLV